MCIRDSSITTYELSPSMENRPSETKEKLSVRFFPEGGQLVEGVTSVSYTHLDVYKRQILLLYLIKEIMTW